MYVLVAQVTVRVTMHGAIDVGVAVGMNQVGALQQRTIAQHIPRRAAADDPPILKH
jgi:hypothetical protein